MKLLEFIQSAFLSVIHMSLSAGVIVLVVIALRFVLRRSTKHFRFLLWSIVMVRLILPSLPKSEYSLMPRGELFNETGRRLSYMIDNRLPDIEFDTFSDISANEYHQAGGDNIVESHMASPSLYLPIIWASGVAVMLTYALASYIRLRRRVAASIEVEKGVMQCDEIDSPFILGLFRPKIYIPSSITEPALTSVLAHEREHISKHDHWGKLLGFVLLSIHWFNPLIWLAYCLICRDIELACDERVIKNYDEAQRADYSQALLDLSRPRAAVTACPLAFGEVSVKERVKSALNYKKPRFWIIAVSIVVYIMAMVFFQHERPFSREIIMRGQNISHIDVDEIIDGIRDVKGLSKDTELYVNAVNNFDITVKSNFDWLYYTNAIDFYYKDYAQNTQHAQLSIDNNNNKYFISLGGPARMPERVTKLRIYLEALKYFPQDEVRRLAPNAYRYIITPRNCSSPDNYERVLRYTSRGAENIDGWYLSFSVLPADENGHSIMTEWLWVYYGEPAEDGLYEQAYEAADAEQRKRLESINRDFPLEG